MSGQIRVITVIHTKPQATVLNETSISHDQMHGTSFGFNKLFVRNMNISGNGGTLPTVLFVTIDTDLAQCYTASKYVRTEVVKEQCTRIPFYTANSSDSKRLIMECNAGEKHPIENKRVKIESVDVTTGNFVAYTDYTCFVLELELEN